MKLLKVLFFCVFFFYGIVQAEIPAITQTLTADCAPLQAFHAFCVDWQMKQWSGAATSFSELRDGGAWRMSFADGKYQDMNSGVFTAYEPGVLLNFDFYCKDMPTKVEIKFERISTQTRMVISQKNFSDDQTGKDCRASMETYWSDMLPRLANYLNHNAGGYLAYPIGNGPFPAVILLHDRFGLNRTMRMLADSLASKGYVALCVDMFKGDVTGDAVQAQRFLSLVNDVESASAIQKAHGYLKSLGDVAERKIGVWGIGYGGSMAMKMITIEPSLKACADWYGSKLPATDELSRISTPILCIFASRDAAAPSPVITAFNQELVQAGVKADLVIIAGNEGFADPANAENYNSESLREAWERTLLFFDRRLRL